jgi:hypothetical protein
VFDYLRPPARRKRRAAKRVISEQEKAADIVEGWLQAKR